MGTGGTPSRGYAWLAAPIIWATNDTGTSNCAGAFFDSIPLNVSQHNRFFRLQVP